MIITSNMNTQLDKRKSFYGKAKLIYTDDDNTIELMSYSTIVAKYDIIKEKITVNGFYSNTTLRHIKEFIYQMTGEVFNKQQIIDRFF